MGKILVTGATGHLGGAVVNFLLGKTAPSTIVALVREPENAKAREWAANGVEIRQGDYNDYRSLITAFEGIDKLYFVSGNDIVHRNKQHENVVKAAKEAGVKHVIYTSVPRKNETETSPISVILESHLNTENWLKEAGLTYTILKHNLYIEMLPVFLGEQLLQTGIAYFPAGDGRVSFTSRTDMAEAAAATLTGEGHENKVYDITNSTAVSFSEIASEVSKASGKSITYVSPTQEEYIKTLSSAGVPMEYVGMFAGFAEGFKQGEFDQTNSLIETLIGRKPLTVSQFLTQVYSPKK